jgi:hypothetical protein
MVNDDCTLVVLRVGDAGAEVAEVVPTAEAVFTSPPEGEVAAGGSATAAGGGGGAERAEDAPPLADVLPHPPAEPGGDLPEGGGSRGNVGSPSPNGGGEEEAEAIAADAGDLMIDLPREPQEPEEQGARDGSPDTTDPEV